MSEDEDSPSLAARLIAVFSLLFFLSCFKSCEEIRFRSSGKTTKATVSSISEEHGRGGRLNGYRIWYDFFNENSKRQVHGYTIVGVEEAAAYALGRQVEIEYYGGDMFNTRFQGTGTVFWLLFFAGTLLATVASGVVLTLRSGQKTRKTPRKQGRAARPPDPRSRGRN